ncbi:class I SAM-dependent methyltransferase [Actinophytocola sp. NPDC049390]|uniref:class I SAM-dependent methyltransferase n=1 Tax=Actinophytocola sp. NPDC049390 TaxID=3363894 RepID=UPI0037BC2050
MDQQFWDDLYREKDQLWSGAPNGVLVTEVADLPPGQALDLGCGEGADALWLASRGWLVTAVDISEVALARAAAAAGEAKVSWVHADLASSAVPAGAFDLVVALYFSAQREPGDHAIRNMLAAVAPGGTLLYAHHDLTGHEHEHNPDFNRHDFYFPEDVAALLDADEWTIVTHETRARVNMPSEAMHVNDIVLKASRR